MIKAIPVFCALILSCSCSLPASEGTTITVTVTNIPGVKGDLLIGLYSSAESFTDKPMKQSLKIPLTSREDLVACIPNVPPGTYSIAVIQDLNRNGVLDKNFFGMPKEPLAFSVIKKIPNGAPKFSECSFEVRGTPIALMIPLTIK